MKITRSRELTFRPANYESVRTAATVEADTAEVELAEGETLEDKLDTMLDDLLALDVARAAAMSTVPGDDTFVHAWKGETVNG